VIGRLLTAAALAVGLLSASPGQAQDKVVNVYNWTDYIDPKVIEAFTAETGIRVQYDVYDSLETLEAKLLTGRSGYDVAVPTNEPTMARLIRAKALAELDRARVPNWRNLDPALMARVAASDPGNRFGAIYLWGTVGMGVLPARIKALAPDAPIDSWDLLFKPAHAKRLQGCGISIMDSAIDVIPSVLRYLGRPPDSTDAKDLAAVEKALMAIRPYVRNFANAGALEALASGQTCLAVTYSGDVIQARERAKEAGRGVAVAYVLPNEGAQVAFDMLVIPADAPNPDAAHAFIDFVLRPPMMAAITAATRYPNAVPATRALLPPALLADTNVFPTEAQMAGFFSPTGMPPAAERARTRMWARFKAGR
jgi:putrescine transport system substrate-binding protein